MRQVRLGAQQVQTGRYVAISLLVWALLSGLTMVEILSWPSSWSGAVALFVALVLVLAASALSMWAFDSHELGARRFLYAILGGSGVTILGACLVAFVFTAHLGLSRAPSWVFEGLRWCAFAAFGLFVWVGLRWMISAARQGGRRVIVGLVATLVGLLLTLLTQAYVFDLEARIVGRYGYKGETRGLFGESTEEMGPNGVQLLMGLTPILALPYTIGIGGSLALLDYSRRRRAGTAIEQRPSFEQAPH